MCVHRLLALLITNCVLVIKIIKTLKSSEIIKNEVLICCLGGWPCTRPALQTLVQRI